MLTKGMIMTVAGLLGIIITIVTFIIVNKNIKKQINLLMESEISAGQYESGINDKVNRYVMKTKLDIFETESTGIHSETSTIVQEQSTTIEEKSTDIEEQSTIILEDSKTLMEEESTILL